MAVISRDLGPVTAYAAAVNRGYTGTRAEFEELMASYATVAQEAGESASAAADSASDAESSASAAATSASDASSFASAANTSAGNASNAATAAGIAQTAAESARDAAHSAQTAAEAAQEGAETAVEGFDSAVTQAISDVNAAGTNQKELAKRQAEKSEAWAVGKISGEDVGVSDPAYHNNAKYYAESAGTSATTATTKAGEAAQSAANAAASASAAAESARTLTIDGTLTQPGQAADAKMTGDKIDGVKYTLNASDLYQVVYPDVMRNKGVATVIPDYVNYSVNNQTGELSSANSKRVCNKTLIYIPDGANFTVTNGDTTTYYNPTKFCFDENKTFIASTQTAGLLEGTRYVRLLTSRKDNSNLTPQDVNNAYTVTISKQTEHEEIDALKAEIPTIVNETIATSGINKYNPDTKVTGFISANTGAINPIAEYFTSDFVDVSNFTNGYAFTPKARKILFYDADKNPIAASFYPDETAAGVIALDSTYKYVRMSWYKSSTNVMICDASTLPAYQPFEVIAKGGIDYLNENTKTKVQQMVGEGGKSTQLASFLNGKTIAVFGDSIMYGAGSDAKGPADLLAEKYNMILAKYCVSGATMGVRTDDPQYTVDEAHHIAKQVRDAISAGITPDVIIFNGGTNDIGGQIPIGTMSAVYTQPSSESYFADGFETVAYLLTKNFVGVPIVYMRAHNMSSRTYQGQVDYGELGNSIAEKWGIETADMYKHMNTQLAEYRTAYLADYTHPNEAGYNKYYIPAIENFVFNKMV